MTHVRAGERLINVYSHRKNFALNSLAAFAAQRRCLCGANEAALRRNRGSVAPQSGWHAIDVSLKNSRYLPTTRHDFPLYIIMWNKENETFLKKKRPKVCRFRKKQYLCTRIQGNASHYREICGNSSVGRARPCQGRGRGSESRLPLIFLNNPMFLERF